MFLSVKYVTGSEKPSTIITLSKRHRAY